MAGHDVPQGGACSRDWRVATKGGGWRRRTLGPAEAAEGGVGRLVGLAQVAPQADGLPQPVPIVSVQQRAVHDGGAQVLPGEKDMHQHVSSVQQQVSKRVVLAHAMRVCCTSFSPPCN
jgi:hypothetical protein